MSDHESQGSDQTQNFLDSLEEVKPGQCFRFACHPGVRCFNACCSDLNLMLTPYDAMRLRKALNMGSEEFLAKHARISNFPDTGFPALHLNMTDLPGNPCPFVREEGCSIYPHRPAACRTYPIGRASRVNEQDEIVEQFFVVREDHCMGFEEDKEWDIEAWTSDQGLEEYNESNLRFMQLLNAQKKRGPITQRHASMILLALYQLDRFQSFIQSMQLFKRVRVEPERQERILSDEEATLEFAMDWLELLLTGKSDRLHLITDPFA